MLFNNEWYMDKSEAQEKVLAVDDGALSIGSECWVYGEEVDRIDANGNFCGVFWQETKGIFEELIVPSCVTAIDERAFYRHIALKKISVLESVTEIGKEAFKGCDGLAFVVAPKVGPSSVADPESKMKLAIGYLLNKALYEEAVAQDYEVYAKKQKTKLVQAAQKYGLTEVEAMLDASPSEKKAQPKKSEKLSAEDAVLLLEHTVLTGSKEEISAVIKAHKPFAMMARALGLACRCRDQEIVQLLLKEKADFRYASRSQITKFGLSYKPSGKEFVADFSLLMAVENVWNPYLFGAMDKYYVRKNAKTVYSPYLKTDKDVSAVPDEMKMAPAQERIANVELLIKKKVLGKEELNLLLYYTILEEQAELTTALIEMGAVIDVPWLIADADHSGCISEMNQYLDAMNDKPEDRRLEVLRAFATQLERSGKKLYISDVIFTGLNGRTNAEIAQLLLDHGDDSAINKKQYMQQLVKLDAAPGVVALLLERNYVKTPKQRDELIALATEQKSMEILSVLMDYKNRTANLAQEADKEAAALEKELTADPNSAAELKKKWTSKKKEDGTLIITSYKGGDTEVIIPERIGKVVVTELGEAVFAVNAQRISNAEVRRRITKIVIPGTVTKIGNAAFWGCANLEEIVVPDSVTKMGTHMFTRCFKLRTLKLSQKHRGAIADHFFSDCEKLEAVTIPNAITSLGLCAFSGCTALKEIHIGKGTKKFEFSWLDKLKGLTIYAPKGSAAEQYALQNNIPFIEE